MSEKGKYPHMLVYGKGNNIDQIAGGGGYGEWDEKWGQEIIEKEIVHRARPGDRVLDLSSGVGRASIAFSMRGLVVISVDSNSKRLTEGNKIRRKAGATPAINLVADIRKINTSMVNGGVDIVIASDALNHFKKQEADDFIDYLPDLLYPQKGGLVYVNAPSTDSFMFINPEYFEATRFDDRTIMIECDCSGKLKLEPVSFFRPGEIEARLAYRGANIIRTNTITRNGCGILHEVVASFRSRH